MNLDQIMQDFYGGLALEPQMWKNDPLFELFDLAKDQYQFLENGEYNETMFSSARKEVSVVINQLFPGSQEVIIVIDTASQTVNGKHHGFVRKIIKQRKSVVFSSLQSDYHKGEGEQLILTTSSQNIAWSKLIVCLLNQDFPNRRPRFKTTKEADYPSIYLIHPQNGIILHVYDDRGYVIYFPDEVAKEAFEKQK